MCALRFCDSFDHYAEGDILEKWSAVSIAASYVIGATGRRSTKALRFTVTGSSRILSKTLDAQPTWIIGVAFQVQALPPTTSTIILAVQDAGTVQVGVRLNTDGTLSLMRGNSSVLATSTATVSAGNYYYLELKTTIHNTTGTATVRLNGTSVATVSSTDTQQTTTASANQVAIGVMDTSSLTLDVDDLYACDGTGSTNIDFLGDCRVECLLPNGDGSHNAWTPSTGTAHSTLVDEVAPNDDTDYLSTATAGARDSHTLINLSSMTNPLIYGVQHLLSARKDDAGTRQVKALLKSGATTQVGATTHTLTTTYSYYPTLFETDPATGLAWTVAAINALEAGVEAV